MEDNEDLLKKLSELNNILSDMTDEKKAPKGKQPEKSLPGPDQAGSADGETSARQVRPPAAPRVRKPFRLPDEDPVPKSEPVENEAAEPMTDAGDEAFEQPAPPPPVRKAPEPAAPRQTRQPDPPPARPEIAESQEEISSYLDEGLVADEMIILDEESRQEGRVRAPRPGPARIFSRPRVPRGAVPAGRPADRLRADDGRAG
jgi:hypothetical protein